MPPVTPHDLPTERALLGAVLVDPSRLQEALAVGLTPDHLWREGHRRILRAMTALCDAGKPVDFLTVVAELRHRGDLDEAGGPAYISCLTDGVPRSSNASEYASVVMECAKTRSVMEQLTRAHQIAATAGPDAALGFLGPMVAADGTWHLLAQDLRDEVNRQRTRREAKKRLDAEERGPVAVPETLTLRERLARPRTEIRWRIDGWQPCCTRTLLAAQFKAGKTTMVGGLIRSLADGDDWLGSYRVAPIAGSVALLDFEMSPRQLDEWLANQYIRNDDRVQVTSFRGAAASFNILDAACRQRWATWLRERDVTYLIVDCLRPVLDALGLDEHSEAGRFLVCLDALMADAGITEGLVVHHMGHAGERARGDSRLRDWPDVEWRLVRQTEAPDAMRFITAYGRDVNQPEQALAFDSVTRRLTVAGGSRTDAKVQAVLDDILDALAESATPMTGLGIKAALFPEHGKNAVDAALVTGVRARQLVKQDGPRKSFLYSPSVPVSQCVPAVSQVHTAEPESQCPPAYKAGTLDTLLQPDSTCAPSQQIPETAHTDSSHIHPEVTEHGSAILF